MYFFNSPFETIQFDHCQRNKLTSEQRRETRAVALCSEYDIH
uniref:Bm13463 n=1 Tax=Brugia malayi TaxID=6279 RepID=A0A0K0IXX0_BRUMA|nr:Bm13463 [Brugia malayi]